MITWKFEYFIAVHHRNRRSFARSLLASYRCNSANAIAARCTAFAHKKQMEADGEYKNSRRDQRNTANNFSAHGTSLLFACETSFRLSFISRVIFRAMTPLRMNTWVTIHHRRERCILFGWTMPGRCAVEITWYYSAIWWCTGYPRDGPSRIMMRDMKLWIVGYLSRFGNFTFSYASYYQFR